MPQLDFDALWDYQHPERTEVTFRQLLPQAAHNNNPSYYLQLLTQIARTQGLQRQFVEAHATLDTVEEQLSPDLITPTIRYLLERGRIFNSSGQPEEAQLRFQQAWELARMHEEEAFFAIDAAHMLAIAASSFTEKAHWNNIALQAAEAATEEKARHRCGSLYNNLGWTYHDQGEYERALDYFHKALQWQQEHGTARNRSIARWCVGRTLRSLQRTAEALALQQELLIAVEKSGEEQDGYIFEEIAECLLATGQVSESRAYFARAYALLSQDPWFVAQEPARLQRLKQLGEQDSEGVTPQQWLKMCYNV
ncbi:MAG TPA: tetratricopeptide repeat protein [Ktedonosporobacter sp.]|jgi:tetratricopeptide (TPR) repeat protein|nr:tetratricopeptide repeat protein [Ktedonosporobacter sp.]